VKFSSVMFSRRSDEWPTPKALYEKLHAEFRFVDDPRPLGGDANGLTREWESPCFVNPPYSTIRPWMERVALERDAGKTVVVLVPSRTCTAWWHDIAMTATEIRFVRGRLRFGTSRIGAPFPSAVLVFKPSSGAAA